MTQEGISTVRALSHLGHLYPSQLFLPPTALATEGVRGGGAAIWLWCFLCMSLENTLSLLLPSTGLSLF